MGVCVPNCRYFSSTRTLLVVAMQRLRLVAGNLEEIQLLLFIILKTNTMTRIMPLRFLKVFHVVGLCICLVLVIVSLLQSGLFDNGQLGEVFHFPVQTTEITRFLILFKLFTLSPAPCNAAY